MVEKTVSPDSAPGDAFGLGNLRDRKIKRLLAVTAEEAVSRGDVKVLDSNRTQDRGFAPCIGRMLCILGPKRTPKYVGKKPPRVRIGLS